MYCQDCGQEIPDRAKTCSLCGRIQNIAEPAQINSGIVPAILVLICCCQPLGIVALIFAARVSSLIAAGDYAGAEESAKTAKTWAFAGFIGGIFIWGIFLLCSVVKSLLLEVE